MRSAALALLLVGCQAKLDAPITLPPIPAAARSVFIALDPGGDAPVDAWAADAPIDRLVLPFVTTPDWSITLIPNQLTLAELGRAEGPLSNPALANVSTTEAGPEAKPSFDAVSLDAWALDGMLIASRDRPDWTPLAFGALPERLRQVAYRGFPREICTPFAQETVPFAGTSTFTGAGAIDWISAIDPHTALFSVRSRYGISLWQVQIDSAHPMATPLLDGREVTFAASLTVRLGAWIYATDLHHALSRFRPDGSEAEMLTELPHGVGGAVAIDGDPEADPPELFVATASGALGRFDGRGWALSVPEALHGAVDDGFHTGTRVLWLGPGEAIRVHGSGAVGRYTHGAVSTEPIDPDLRLTSLANIPGLGLLAAGYYRSEAGDIGALFLRDPARAVWTPFASSVELASARDLVPWRGGVVTNSFQSALVEYASPGPPRESMLCPAMQIGVGMVRAVRVLSFGSALFLGGFEALASRQSTLRVVRAQR